MKEASDPIPVYMFVIWHRGMPEVGTVLAALRTAGGLQLQLPLFRRFLLRLLSRQDENLDVVRPALKTSIYGIIRA